MEKKATLLIKNIHKVYTMNTMNGQEQIECNVHIAIHHDFILAIYKGDNHMYLDKDTRVIDAHGCIVTPGFIECHGDFIETDTCNKARQQSALFTLAAKHGITTVNFPNTKENIVPHIYCEGVQCVALDTYPIWYVRKDATLPSHHYTSQTCISSYQKQGNGMSLLALGQLLTMTTSLSGLHILKMMTLYPAKRLQLLDVGKIEVGKQADLVIFHALDIQEVFLDIDLHYPFQVIKKGVRIFPNVLI